MRVTGILLAVMILTLNACAFIRGNYGEEVQQGDISAIKKGASTRGDVADLLGAPDRIVEANGDTRYGMLSFGGSKACLSTRHGGERASTGACIAPSSTWRKHGPTCAASDSMWKQPIASPNRSIRGSACLPRLMKCTNLISCYPITRAATAHPSRSHLDR